MANKPKNKKQPQNFSRKTNGWDVLNSFLKGITNKGQLFGFLLIIIVMIIVIRLPAEELKPLADKILDGFSQTYLLGWFLAVLIAILSFFSNRRVRKQSSEDIKRIAEERNKYQRREIGDEKVKSSED